MAIRRQIVSHVEKIAVAAATTAAVSFAVAPTVSFLPAQRVRIVFVSIAVSEYPASGQLSQTDYAQLSVESAAGAIAWEANTPFVPVNPLGDNGSAWTWFELPALYYHDFLPIAGGPVGPGILFDVAAVVKNADAVNAHDVTLFLSAVVEIIDD